MPRYDTSEDLRLSWRDQPRMHWSLASVAVLCVSFVASCDEIRHATSEQTAPGIVMRVLQRPKSKLKIEDQFAAQDGNAPVRILCAGRSRLAVVS
jgi:hypothetical protein